MAASRWSSRRPLTGRAVVGRRRLGLVRHRSGLRRWRPSLLRRPLAGPGARATMSLDDLPVRHGSWLGYRRAGRRQDESSTAGPPVLSRAVAATPRPRMGAPRRTPLGSYPTQGRSLRSPRAGDHPGSTPPRAVRATAAHEEPPAPRRAVASPAMEDATVPAPGRRLQPERIASEMLPPLGPMAASSARPLVRSRPLLPARVARSARAPRPAPPTAAQLPAARPSRSLRAVFTGPVAPVTTPAVPPSARPGPVVPTSPPEPAAPPAAPPRHPEHAWTASVARQPLETPRPLPASWRPLARRLAGTPAVRYTTGPATRAALAATGALGATTGQVIHLHREPVAADAPVVAHELAHARSSLIRPRFLLAGHGHADADEQATRQTVARLPLGPVAPPAAPARSAPEVARLPVGGSAVLVARTPAAAPPVATGGGIAPSPAVSGRQATLARETTPATPAPSPEPAPAATEGQPAVAIDYDRLLRHLDRWLGRELERRGGRYQGVF